MIDLHTHLLPGLDDGAPTLRDTRAMLQRWHALGFEVVVATPHLKRPLDQQFLARVELAMAHVRDLADPLGMTVSRGFEALLTPDLPARLMAGEPVTLAGGRAILVELPFTQWPHYTDQILFEVQSAGFQPILAHPERYDAVQRDWTLALRLAERGVALQVNIGSLTGLYGRRAKRTAENLVRSRSVAVVASDAHSAGRVFDQLGLGLARLRDLHGGETASMVRDRPGALLEGRSFIPPAPSSEIVSEPLWRRLFGDGA